MAQYVYTMRRVGKVVPPKRSILKNISLNFFPGAKIGVLGLNGSGKSSLLKIMAGGDGNSEGGEGRVPRREARPMLYAFPTEIRRSTSCRAARSGGWPCAASCCRNRIYCYWMNPRTTST